MFLKRHALALLVFCGLAVLLTWPLILAPATKLGALNGPGDPYLNLWILGWDLRTISTSPLSLLNGGVFDANIFHPARQTLTYSDHFLLQALCVWPLYAITHNLVLCYNAVLFGSLIASALAMYAFVRGVTGSGDAGLVAGVIWGFWPFHFAHLVHLQLQALYFLPLAFLFLHRLIAGARPRDAVGLGAMAGLQAVASVYWGVIGGLALIVSAVTLVVAVGGRRAGKLIRLGLLAGLVAFLIVLPVLWPYVQAQQREGFARNLYEASQHEATLGSYFTAPRVNLLEGGTAGFITSRDGGVETQLFVGWSVMLLAAFGALAARRRGKGEHWPLAASAIALIIAGFLLSLGPDGIRPLYAALQRWVFGFQAIRAPARFGILVAFGLAVLAAIGTMAFQRSAPRWSSRAWVTLIVILAITGEFANRPLAFVDAPPRSTPSGRWLSQAPRPGAVLYLPLTIDIENTPFMVESLEHGRPIVNGYSGLRPPFYPALVDAMHGFPTADALWTLKDLDVRYVVAPTHVENADARWPLVERAHFDADDGMPERFIYEVVWTPEAEARLGEPSVPSPPPPGSIPFAPGETMVYRVEWDGPTGAVNAGEIEIKVDATKDAAYRFTIAARTAPWIARFYDADDRFITDATADLLPIRQERQLREGRRMIDEAFRFDRDQRVVVSEGRDGRPPLRLWPGARDPISAFFYLRTLPLAPGMHLDVPVNDSGRNLILSVKVDDSERVRVAGVEREALRVMPIVRERVERRQPPDITVWLSDDAQRIPLRASVRAGFGSVRLELEKYSPR